VASESATVHGSQSESWHRQPNGSAEQYESARHTATPHGVCHEQWMAVGVAGQPILPQ
jgi:hypothetical protein